MPMVVGSVGEAVARLQEALASAGFDPGSLDGRFGSSTEAAVREFQISRNLTADGIVGDVTWAALGMTGPAPSPGTVD